MKSVCLVWLVSFLLVVASGRGSNANITSAPELIAQLKALESEEKNLQEDTSSLHANQKAQRELLLKMGETGDQSFVPLLRSFANQSTIKRPSLIAGCAQVALAKLGDTTAYNEIVSELKHVNPVIQCEAFQKLGMVASTSAVKILGSYLNDTSAPAVDPASLPPGYVPARHLRFFRRCHMAAMALSKIIKPAPTQANPELYTDDDIQKWRAWWEANKSKYSE